MTQTLGEDSTFSSKVLRRYFILECLINGYRSDEWAMVQNEPVPRREPKRGQGLLHSFRQLLGCAGHYRRLEDN